jgi:hypothetical protein
VRDMRLAVIQPKHVNTTVINNISKVHAAIS